MTSPLTQQMLDPSKRVHYTLGLVLGVDEFQQEQTYVLERDRLHHRGLHGYGTVDGLQVYVRGSGEGPEVVVTPGMAVDPNGQAICVPTAQCASLDGWLNRMQEDVQRRVGTLPGPLAVYVTLCYRECKTDRIPVPGGPCRSQEDTMTPSRIQDDFELRLSLRPPPQPAEEAVRRFGALLAGIRVTDRPGVFLTEADVIALVRALAEEAPTSPPSGSPPSGSPPSGSPPSDFPPESPPGSPPTVGRHLFMHPDEAAGLLRTAFRIWTTEVQPQVAGRSVCGPEGAADPCILLGRLDLTVERAGSNLRVSGSSAADPGVTVRQEDRPYLLSTRLLQEWLLCSPYGEGLEVESRTFATLLLRDPSTVRAWIHHPVLVEIPAGAVRLAVDGAGSGSPPAAVGVTRAAPDVNVFDLSLPAPVEGGSLVTARFDTLQITERGSPGLPLADVLDESDYLYLDGEGTDLLVHLGVDRLLLADLHDVTAPAPGDGEVLAWSEPDGQWMPRTLALDDLRDVDVAGATAGSVLARQGDGWAAIPLAAPVVERLDDIGDVEAQEPAHGDLLSWDGEQERWVPVAAHPGGVNRLDELEDVAAPGPEEGQVLTWDGTQWVAATPEAGGVTEHGALAGLGDDDHPQYLNQARGDARYAARTHTHRVEELSNVEGVAPQDGQVLVRRGTRWVPEAQTGGGDAFVMAPFGPYAIVAAGYFQVVGDQAGTAEPVGPTYNRLEARSLGPSDYALTFDGYGPPDDGFMYIVKGTIADFPEPGRPRATFEFVSFLEEGIHVRVLSIDNRPLIKGMGFMVEVSAYGERRGELPRPEGGVTNIRELLAERTRTPIIPR